MTKMSFCLERRDHGADALGLMPHHGALRDVAVEYELVAHLLLRVPVQTLPAYPRTTAYSSPFRLHAERKDGGEEPEQELELRHSSETARSSEGRR